MRQERLLLQHVVEEHVSTFPDRYHVKNRVSERSVVRLSFAFVSASLLLLSDCLYAVHSLVSLIILEAELFSLDHFLT